MHRSFQPNYIMQLTIEYVISLYATCFLCMHMFQHMLKNFLIAFMIFPFTIHYS
ncbi:hypothetical protein GLOIN_2v1617049 [Rhizophagus irregularis DAOM 181602=DAOM 197198]|uniref:Uncharacterized protein n=1 Tax=Rhizophagus irregularis (strain DAOM 181602 / DAOM 197198 / MUCL 43194) TaxID=747089 RepID=A0A2P4PY95_RHIID|nr:hypothetical protein GLOIN_2v1617049 [Rhizophagus irregularis DAOM 181602=DAOM 197198]POG70358.1 hypothetical protein GLOIN_2v1617049 [Rhizophagus irregularis DAOM 181602=DAOM 197198]|eukprot:XP_025177224.1 hypothetical protein GLOIN_2v1617049 [Rhizophagus irregularis DAOM 181602=DAOM 197198]